MEEKRKVVAVIENHFDQIWRRCFKRDLLWNGKNFISYAKIEGYYIDKNLELAEKIPDYKFQIENPCTVETYVERFPEKKEILKKLYADGVLKTTNTGYVILDSNFIHPEAIIRNYLISDAFFKEYMGKTPRIANRSDAFGNSAQLPQILKNFGAEYVTEIYYNPFNDDVWVGLDKSAICVKTYGYQGGGGGWSKYPPCKKCNGFGKIGDDACPECNGMGIDVSVAKKVWRNVRVSSSKDKSGIMRVGGEEFIPSPDTPKQIENIRKEQGIDITLGHWDFLIELFQKEIDQVKNGDFTGLKVRTSPEFNPNTTGGYTTRIKIKQELCDKENKLLAGETLEAMRKIKGETPYSYDNIWRKYLLCGFHDSAYGTIVDKGYDEIMDMFADIDDVVKGKYLASDASDEVRLFNPTSSKFHGIYESEDGRIAIVDEVEPYSFKKVKYEAAPERIEKKAKELMVSHEVVLTGNEEKILRENTDEIISIDNEYFTVEADDKGIRKITDKRYGAICDILDGIRPFEWILESDNGSPWARLEAPYRTTPLSDTTTFVCLEKGEKYKKLCFKTKFSMQVVNIPAQNQYMLWSVTLFDGYDKVRLDADVNWAAANVRLMTCVPIPVENGKDIYGIPGGWLEREPYEPTYSWNGADGDYPAYRYGGVESKSKSVAVFNRGTPAYKILPANGGKKMYVTVLRSPTHPVCLHEADAYTMTEYDGMRDEGKHSFSFELAAYGTNLSNSRVVVDAEHFYRRLLPVGEGLQRVELPTVISGSATITHVKSAENGKGVIVRVTEHAGIECEVELSLPSWVSGVGITGMSERTAEIKQCDSKIKLNLKAFQIVSLIIL